jgi:hypothetical protein
MFEMTDDFAFNNNIQFYHTLYAGNMILGNFIRIGSLHFHR